MKSKRFAVDDLSRWKSPELKNSELNRSESRYSFELERIQRIQRRRKIQRNDDFRKKGRISRGWAARLSISSSSVFVPLRSFFSVRARDNRFGSENCSARVKMDKNVNGWMDGRTDAWKKKKKRGRREKEMRRGDRAENRDADVMEWLVWPTSIHA